MSEVVVMTLMNNDCDCVETGECLCTEILCVCDCDCYDCSQEIISSCICGNGQCLCEEDDLDKENLL